MKSGRCKADIIQRENDGDRVSKGEIIAYGLGGFAGTLPNQFRMQFHMNLDRKSVV